MKDAIKALRVERKRLMAAVKQVDKTLKAAGAGEGAAKRPRRKARAKALGSSPLKAAPGSKAVKPVRAAGAGENSDVAEPVKAARPATPVQPKGNGPSARRPQQSVDDLLKD